MGIENVHGGECFDNKELLKALRDAERQVRLFRADIVGLHKKFKQIERRLAKLEVRSEPVKPPFTIHPIAEER